MPSAVLGEMPAAWVERAPRREYGLLEVIVPAINDLLLPKLKRGEPRVDGLAQSNRPYSRRARS